MFARMRIWLVVLFVVPAALFAKENPFPCPEGYRPAVDFWVSVYSTLHTNQVVFFDNDDLDLVYYVIDLPTDRIDVNARDFEKTISKAKEEVASALRELDQKRPKSADGLSGVTKQVYLALKKKSREDKYAFADNVRSQMGLKERFLRGYMNAGAYEDEIRARLLKQGLEEDLIGIVFVESLFHAPSVSKVGATGYWQFIKPTALSYAHVNALVDERLDPMVATEAAIRYLKAAKSKLKTWPLAIVSYNCGQGGMAKAAAKIGSYELGDILDKHEGKTFKFASRNYYFEFLAAVEVYKNAKQIFPNAIRKKPWRYEVVRLAKAVHAPDLVRSGAFEEMWFETHNPALSKAARTGGLVLPADFTLRVPEGQSKRFHDAYNRLARSQKLALKAEKQKKWVHKASGKETIAQIAKRYGMSKHVLAKKMGVKIGHKPKRGTQLVLGTRIEKTGFSALPAHAGSIEAAVAQLK
jgi:membrane-bound lytic murein transglycosylase D